jgi:hypothetical protein
MVIPETAKEQMMMRVLNLPAVVMLACAAGCSQRNDLPQPVPDTMAPAPWLGARVNARDIPPVYRDVWSKAENRATCALIVLADIGAATATPRAATFSGGWAVAYDQPDLRSAFGIAGAGVNAADPSYDAWPYKRTWSDGSTVGYGPEGGTGPNQLAYLRITGQRCLYNVWSRLGKEHLERLLGGIRLVETGS